MNSSDPHPTWAARSPGPRRRRLGRLAALALLVLLCAVLVPLALPDHDGVTRAAARARSGTPAWVAQELAGGASARAEVSLASPAGGTAVPPSYLGLSTEYWTLPLYAPHIPLLERALALVHAQGDGPLLLRIGGDSADHSFWEPGARRTAPWVFHLTPAWLRETSTIVRGGGVRLILDLNLVTDSPWAAAQWARAADSGLPRGSIAGLEIGNEPDIYSRWDWLAVLARAIDNGLLPSGISALSYTHAFALYARALAHAAPRIPLIGPAIANPVWNINWFRTLIAQERPKLGVLSAHRYPLSACAPIGSRNYPTVGRLLSERASTGLAVALRPVVRVAHRARLPLRLTELNSVTCGGVNGISNTFATALWAPDTLFSLLRAGVDGVNVHVRGHPINAAFVFDGRGLVVRPLLYGLILFARTLGQDAHLLPVTVHGAPSLHLKVWAVRVRGNVLHMLLIDKGARSVRVDLRLPSYGTATVQRLLAPAAGSHSDVLLGGQHLGRQATWLGAPASETLRPGRHGYVLVLPRESAALVRVRLRSPSLVRRHTANRQPTRRRAANRHRVNLSAGPSTQATRPRHRLLGSRHHARPQRHR